MILTGSLPGLTLLAPARTATCDCPGPCPCRTPARSSAPAAPGLVQAGVVSVAGQVQTARDLRREPSPCPEACLLRAAAQLAQATPALLPRPGPETPPGPQRQALLSVFRI
jgi:hypothetical protein